MKKEVVVIGAGLGGLSTAITLAQYAEYNITVIEKNAHLGGKLNVLVKDGFEFDLGPSIFTMPHIFEKLFTIHNKNMEDYLTLEKVRPHWRNFFEDKTIIDLTAKIDDMINNDKVSKSDVEELHAFYKYTERLYNFTKEVFFDNQSEKVLDTLKHYPWLKIMKDSDYFKTMDEGIRNYITNPYLIDILDYFIKYVGSSSYDAPAVLNVLSYIQWKFDLWYVKGGLFNLSKGLETLIKELPQIKILTNSEVTNIEKKNNEIVSVTINKKDIVKADIIVSNMEVIPFYEKISKEDPKKIKKYKKKYGPACSGFALHLGVDREYDILAHHNFFYSKNLKLNFDNIFHNHKLSKDPTIYLVAPMKSDKTIGPKGSEIIKILPHISVIDPDNPFTEEEYQEFRENVLDKLERLGLENLREHIVTEELWIPETIEEMYYSNQGSIYGVISDRKKNLGFKTPKKSEFYNNLYFVGGSVNPGGGMPMVVLSGQQVVDQIRNIK